MSRLWAMLTLGVALSVSGGAALADRGHGGHGGHWHSHVGVGVVIDPFWYSPWYYSQPYYYPPYYYPPTVVTVPETPPVYIERDDMPAPAHEPSAYWYYCADPKGYYPDVKQCPGGWQPVAPQPDNPPSKEK